MASNDYKNPLWAKKFLEAQQQAETSKAADLALGTPGLSEQTKKPKEPMADTTKAALVTGGTQALGGLLAGLAEALLYEDESAKQSGHAAIPSGSVGSVGHSNTPADLTAGRMQLPADRASMALALLQKGGYR